MGGYIGATAVGLTTTAADVQGDITSTDTTPELILKNTSEEDTEGGREGKITFKGEQSGGEETTLAQIESAHDGTSDDEKGDLIFKTNDGNDGAAPTERLRLDSAGDMLLSSPDPSFTITNTTQEDTDGGRESTIVFKGEQSGGELSTLAEIEASHDGTADDEKGDLIFRTNDGSDGASPTEAMRIDSAQNVGIGESNPSLGGSANGLHITGASGNDGVLKLDSSDSTHSGKIQFTENGTDQWRIAYDPTNNHLEFTESGVADRMVIQDGGNVGINESSPSHKLDVDGNIAVSQGSRYYLTNDSGFSPNITNTGASNAMQFFTGNAERMRIDSSGSVMINKTTTAQFSDAGHAFIDDGRYFSIAGFSNSSQETLTVYSTGVSSFRFYVDYGGTIHATSTSISAISDQRLKENITDLDTGLDEVLALRPRRFDWINGDGENVAGFIAQEVETVLPDLIDNFKHTELSDAKGLKMGDMIPTLVKAIQELSAKVTTLETQNTTQATQIADLITRVEALEGA